MWPLYESPWEESLGTIETIYNFQKNCNEFLFRFYWNNSKAVQIIDMVALTLLILDDVYYNSFVWHNGFHYDAWDSLAGSNIPMYPFHKLSNILPYLMISFLIHHNESVYKVCSLSIPRLLHNLESKVVSIMKEYPNNVNWVCLNVVDTVEGSLDFYCLKDGNASYRFFSFRSPSLVLKFKQSN